MRYHHQNLTDGRLPLWRHGRAWLGKLRWEWVVLHRPSFSLGIGARHLTVCLVAFSLYLTWGESDPFDRREFSVSIHNECVWIEHPWARTDGWRSDDPWWRKQIVLRVVDWLLGARRFSSSEEKIPDVLVPLPEGCYIAQAKMVRRRWWRRFGWFQLRRDAVELSVDGGIPFAGKGENSWDCGDDALCGWSGESVEDAIANGVKTVLVSRRKRGLDSKETGAVPARIVNAKAAGEET